MKETMDETLKTTMEQKKKNRKRIRRIIFWGSVILLVLRYFFPRHSSR